MKKLVLLLILSGCTTQMASRVDQQNAQQIALFEEVRVALSDVRQAVNAHKLDIALLEEKLAKLEKRPDGFTEVEKRLASLEKSQDNAMSDLRTLSRHAKESSNLIEELRGQLSILDQRISAESERMGEVANLRSTLSSLTKAMNSQTQSAKSHRVKPGESLERIARQYQTTIEEIKNANGLTSNKILVGQELKIPN